jgi:hypothetical protein
VKRLSAASLVISMAALFFALSGAGLAAQHAPTDALGKVVVMCAATTPFRKCQIAGSEAVCPPGAVVTGGGWIGVHGRYALDASVVVNGPQKSFGWLVEMENHDTSTGTFRALAICST